MIVYSKYNSDRREKFQLLTTIEKEGNILFAAKRNLTSEAKPFLDSLLKKYRLLSQANFSFKPVQPIPTKDGKLSFEYLDYAPLEYYLLNEVKNKNKEGFLNLVKGYIALIEKNEIIRQPVTKEFTKIFGKPSQKFFLCLKFGCMDLNFPNILYDRKKEEYHLIDYEWTFNFPIPYKFIIFRSLAIFYLTNLSYSPQKLINREDLFKLLNIKQIDTYSRFEYNFQKYVNRKHFANLNLFKEYLFPQEKRAIYSSIQNFDNANGNINVALQEKEISLRKKEQIILEQKKEIDSLSEKISARGNDIAHKNNEIDAYKRKNLELKQVIARYKREHEKLTNSYSWKYTGPIRHFVRLLRKIFFYQGGTKFLSIVSIWISPELF